MNDNEENDVTVSPEEVNAFLNETAKEEKRVPLDLDPEVLEVLSDKEDIDESKDNPSYEPNNNDPKIDTPLREDLQPGVPTLNEHMRWSFNAGPDLLVKVEDREKDLYLKSALTDTKLELDIPLPLPGDPVVRCCALSEKDTKTVFTALDMDIKEEKFSLETQYNTQLQNYSMCLQIMSVGNIVSKYFLELPQDLPCHDAACELRQHFSEKESELNATTRSLYIMALRLFTIKCKLCADNMANGNFWKPSDID